MEASCWTFLKFDLPRAFDGAVGMLSMPNVHTLLCYFLCQVMTKPKNALTKQYTYQFCMDDVDFHMTDGALRAVAQTAIKKNTGARGLRSIMESVLLEVRIIAFFSCFFSGSNIVAVLTFQGDGGRSVGSCTKYFRLPGKKIFQCVLCVVWSRCFGICTC